MRSRDPAMPEKVKRVLADHSPLHLIAHSATRFYADPESGDPHFARHGLSQEDVVEVLARPLEDRPGHDGARTMLGRTRAGMCIRVVYVIDSEPDPVFVITAYEIGVNTRKALLRRLRRRR